MDMHVRNVVAAGRTVNIDGMVSKLPNYIAQHGSNTVQYPE